MKTILFMGDSITDAGRCRTDDHLLGNGYATMTAGKIGVGYPGAYQCINRGISGNRSIDIYARINEDILDLKPDFISILMGVNDVWHGLEADNGVSPEVYRQTYSMLLEKISQQLPQTKVIIMEPYVQSGSGTNRYLEQFREGVNICAKISKSMAEQYHAFFVPLQQMLDDFAAKTSNETVLLDGVHPTYVGHALISNALFAQYQKLL